MPVLEADARPEDYDVAFPEASGHLRIAARWLRERGHKANSIVAYSMGARMSDRFLVEAAQPGAPGRARRRQGELR